MPGAKKQTNVTLRNDLKELVSELSFDTLNVQGDLIAPVCQVPLHVGAYPVLPREAVAKVPDTRRQKGGTYGRGEWDWTQDTYTTRPYGWEEVVDNLSSMENEQFIDEEAIASEIVVQKLLLGREARIAESILDTSFWTGASNFHTITNEWDDATNMDILLDIDTCANLIRSKAGIARSLLTLTVTDDNFNYIFRGAKVKDDVKYTSFLQTQPMETKKQWLATFLGIKNVRVVSNFYDTGALGSDFSLARFWSNEYSFLGYSPESVNIKTPCAIKQLNWSRFAKDYVMESYVQEEIDGEVIRAKEYRGIKRNLDYGVLLGNCKTTVDSTSGV